MISAIVGISFLSFFEQKATIAMMIDTGRPTTMKLATISNTLLLAACEIGSSKIIDNVTTTLDIKNK